MSHEGNDKIIDKAIDDTVIDFNAYVEEAVEMVGRQRDKLPGGERGIIPESYYTGYIYGLRASKLIFEEYEQKSREEVKDE